jgi:predicted RNase H-like nuclease
MGKNLGAPKYNPAVRKRFQPVAWQSVLRVLIQLGLSHTLQNFDSWCETMLGKASPRKSDQDKVDALICAFVGLHWLRAPRVQSVMIGDLESGYMIAPAPNGIHEKLASAAQSRGVPIV